MAERSTRSARTRHRGPAAPVPGSVADLTPDANPEQVARTIALRRLNAAPRTRAELSATLREKGVPDDVAATVLDRFEQVQLIDDQAYAESWVRSRHEGRGLSRRALAGELIRKGVDRAVVEDSVAQISDDTEIEAARLLVRRKLRAGSGEDPQRQLRRLTGLLARKGYGASVCFAAVRAELEQLAGSGDAQDQPSIGELDEAGESWGDR